jgi:quinol monooxygenase YgiN
MSQVNILGTVEFVAGTREQLLTAIDAHRARSLADEPGTLQFEILIPRDQETTIYLYEAYADEQAFEAHLNGSSFGRVAAETADIITALTTSRVTTYIPTTAI